MPAFEGLFSLTLLGWNTPHHPGQTFLSSEKIHKESRIPNFDLLRRAHHQHHAPRNQTALE